MLSPADLDKLIRDLIAIGYPENLAEALGSTLGNLQSGDIHSDGSNPFAADQSMGGHALVDVQDPSSPQDAATKAYVDAVVGGDGAILQNGSTPFTGNQSMGDHNLTNVSDPVSAQDAATKNYIDTNFLDLACTNKLTGALRWSGNLGAVGAAPVGAQIADLNGDGDIQIIANIPGASGNLISWQQVDDVTAGSEYFSVVGNAIVCHIQAGVTTDDDISNEFYGGVNNPAGAAAARALVQYNENIGGGIVQNAIGPVFLTGGVDPENPKTIYSYNTQLGDALQDGFLSVIGLGQFGFAGASLGSTDGWSSNKTMSDWYYGLNLSNASTFFNLTTTQHTGMLSMWNRNDAQRNYFFQFQTDHSPRHNSSHLREFRLIGDGSPYTHFEEASPAPRASNIVWDGDGNGDMGIGCGYASGTIQDITWYAIDPGDGGNGIVVQYVQDVSAGQEYFSYDGTTLTLHLSSSGIQAHALVTFYRAFYTDPAHANALSILPAIPICSFAARNNVQTAPDSVTLSGGVQNALLRPNQIFLKSAIELGGISTSVRDVLPNLAAGAIVFNSDTNKHQAYDGTTWHDLY